MLRWAILFLIVAIIAGVFGFATRPPQKGDSSVIGSSA